PSCRPALGGMAVPREVDLSIAPVDRPGAASGLPAWYPAWARELAELYFSGTTCLFLLHGNVHDLVRCPAGEQFTYCNLPAFLAQAGLRHRGPRPALRPGARPAPVGRQRPKAAARHGAAPPRPAGRAPLRAARPRERPVAPRPVRRARPARRRSGPPQEFRAR